MTIEETLRARAHCQMLQRPLTAPPVADLVGRLLAVQAQDAQAAALALRARAERLAAADVTAAREDRDIVRAWGPRGTLHLITAEDVRWLLPLLCPSMIPNTRRRLKEERVDPDGALPVVAAALAGQGPLTKAALGERLRRAGLRAEGQAIVHLAALAACHGLAVLGPDQGGKATYVHAADWLGSPLPGGATEIDADRALAELARRYLRAHAPAGPADLAAWSGLPLREARRGWGLIGGELAEEGGLWRLRAHPAGDPPTVLRMVPAFDEFLLGWAQRHVPDAHRRKVHPGGGILRPTVIADGRIVGTWRARRTGRGLQFSVEPFGEPPGYSSDDLSDEMADIRRFLAAA